MFFDDTTLLIRIEKIQDFNFEVLKGSFGLLEFECFSFFLSVFQAEACSDCLSFPYNKHFTWIGWCRIVSFALHEQVRLQLSSVMSIVCSDRTLFCPLLLLWVAVQKCRGRIVEFELCCCMCEFVNCVIETLDGAICIDRPTGPVQGLELALIYAK